MTKDEMEKLEKQLQANQGTETYVLVHRRDAYSLLRAVSERDDLLSYVQQMKDGSTKILEDIDFRNKK